MKESETTAPEGENEPVKGYDPKEDPRLQDYVRAMTKAHNREDKRAAGRKLRRRGKGYTK